MSSASDSDRLERRANRLVEDHDNFMQDLVRFRRAHNLTQRDVAERMGVSQPTVAAFEHYDSNPTLSTIQRYAMAVGAVTNMTVVDDCEASAPNRWSKVLRGRATFAAPAAPKATPPGVTVSTAVRTKVPAYA